eukprot:scaffold168198_cov31-Tisochrysis_lutea.AAC.2
MVVAAAGIPIAPDAPPRPDAPKDVLAATAQLLCVASACVSAAHALSMAAVEESSSTSPGVLSLIDL